MEERIAEVYKLVYTDPSWGLLSISVIDCPQACVHYIPGRWTKAPVGGLLVFESKETALSFVNPQGLPLDRKRYWELWLASARSPVDLPEERLCLFMSSSKNRRRFWQDGKIPWLLRSGPWPPGTKAYKFVRLERKLL